MLVLWLPLVCGLLTLTQAADGNSEQDAWTRDVVEKVSLETMKALQNAGVDPVYMEGVMKILSLRQKRMTKPLLLQSIRISLRGRHFDRAADNLTKEDLLPRKLCRTSRMRKITKAHEYLPEGGILRPLMMIATMQALKCRRPANHLAMKLKESLQRHRQANDFLPPRRRRSKHCDKVPACKKRGVKKVKKIFSFDPDLLQLYNSVASAIFGDFCEVALANALADDVISSLEDVVVRENITAELDSTTHAHHHPKNTEQCAVRARKINEKFEAIPVARPVAYYKFALSFSCEFDGIRECLLNSAIEGIAEYAADTFMGILSQVARDAEEKLGEIFGDMGRMLPWRVAHELRGIVQGVSKGILGCVAEYFHFNTRYECLFKSWKILDNIVNGLAQTPAAVAETSNSSSTRVFSLQEYKRRMSLDHHFVSDPERRKMLNLPSVEEEYFQKRALGTLAGDLRSPNYDPRLELNGNSMETTPPLSFEAYSLVKLQGKDPVAYDLTRQLNGLPTLEEQYRSDVLLKGIGPTGLSPHYSYKYDSIYPVPRRPGLRRSPVTEEAPQASSPRPTLASRFPKGLYPGTHRLQSKPTTRDPILQSYRNVLPTEPTTRDPILQSYRHVLPTKPATRDPILQSYRRILPTLPAVTAPAIVGRILSERESYLHGFGIKGDLSGSIEVPSLYDQYIKASKGFSQGGVFESSKGSSSSRSSKGSSYRTGGRGSSSSKGSKGSSYGRGSKGSSHSIGSKGSSYGTGSKGSSYGTDFSYDYLSRESKGSLYGNLDNLFRGSKGSSYDGIFRGTKGSFSFDSVLKGKGLNYDSFLSNRKGLSLSDPLSSSKGLWFSDPLGSSKGFSFSDPLGSNGYGGSLFQPSYGSPYGTGLSDTARKWLGPGWRYKRSTP